MVLAWVVEVVGEALKESGELRKEVAICPKVGVGERH
jgi:hypothetical protein